MDKAIGAGGGHYLEDFQFLRGKFHAPGVDCGSDLVVSAATGFSIEITAGDVGVVKLTGIFVFEFNQTAAPASITEGLPLFRR